MSTEVITCYLLRCDIQADDCYENLTDHDTEGDIHGSSPEEIRGWATGSNYEFDWIALPEGRDVCPQCRQALGDKPHGFIPDARGSSMCLLCRGWATDHEGLGVVRGQLEIPRDPVPMPDHHGAYREPGKGWIPNHPGCSTCEWERAQAATAIHPDVLDAEDGAPLKLSDRKLN